MRIEPELSSAQIVLVGSFNPRIFRPEWFAKNELISQSEAEEAEIEIIHPEIAIFRAGSIGVRVEQQRFIVDTNEAPLVSLFDLVVRTFKEFLIHTPAGKLGINRIVHFSVGDEATRNRIGKTLAPHEPWGQWAPEIQGDEGEGKRGGMRVLVMEQRTLPDRYKGHIQAKVEPSTTPNLRFNGIFMQVNDHYEIENPDAVVGCQEIIDMLEKNFTKSIQRSEWIIDQIMALR